MKFSDITYKQRITASLLFLFSSIFFLLNINFESTGDTIYYANIIDTLQFGQLTAHQGYYLLGYLVKNIAGMVFTVQTDQVLAIMSTLFGAATLVVGYSLLNHYLDSEHDALIATLMLFICHRFYENVTSAEIYIVQTFFIWGAFLLFEKQRFYLSGLSIAMALWISPLTAIFGPWFLIVAYIRNFGIYSILRLGIPVAVIYFPFLFFFYEELLWGNRGLINEDERRTLDIIEGGKNFIGYQFKHYTSLNLLLVPALFALAREKKLLWISLAAVLPNIYIISQLRSEDNVFILPLDIYFVCWFIIGWQELRSRSLSWVAVIMLLFHIAYFLATERPLLNDSNKYYDEEMRTINDIIHKSDNPVLMADWTRRMAFVYYNRDIPDYPLEKGYWYELSFDISHFDTRRDNIDPEAIIDNKTVFVLESWASSTHARLILGEDTLEQRYQENSQKIKLESILSVSCKPVFNGINTLYQCN